MPTKTCSLARESRRQIDGAVAAIMAVGRAMLNKGEFMSPYADDDYDPTDARLD